MSHVRIGQAAEYLDISVVDVCKAARENHLPSVLPARGQRLFRTADLEAFIGLVRLLEDVTAGEFTVVCTSHRNQLSRSGSTWTELYVDQCGKTVEILYGTADNSLEPEPVADAHLNGQPR